MSTLFEIARNLLAVVGLLVVVPIGFCVAYVSGQDIKEWLTHLLERRRGAREALQQVRVEIAAMERGERS